MSATRDRIHPALGPFAVSLLAVTVVRLLGVLLPTTWEWDALIRAVQAAELAEQGPLTWFTTGARTVWLPGVQSIHALILHITGADPVAVGEWMSAVACGVIALYTFGLARLAGVPAPRRWQAVALIASSGTALAYFSQAMTEAYSVASFVALAYHGLAALQAEGRRHAVAAAAAFFLYASARWEGILLLGVLPVLLTSALPAPRMPQLRRLAGPVVLVMLPAALFAAGFLAYSQWISGATLDAVRAVGVDAPETRWFKGNPIAALRFMSVGLLVTQGALWIAAIPAAIGWPRSLSPQSPTDERQAFVRRLLGRTVVYQGLWFGAFLFAGLIYPSYRYLLVSLPLSAVLALTTPWSRRAWSLVVLTSALIGAAWFSFHRLKHENYMAGDPRYYRSVRPDGRVFEIRR